MGANKWSEVDDGAAVLQEATHEDEGYVIRDGIVVIIKDSTIPDGTVI